MATNFLWDAGTSNNGLLTSTFDLMTTELESLANNAVIISSVGGSSGVFTNSNTGQGVLATLILNVGNPGITSALSSGAALSGWFLESYNGSVFESTTVAPPRPADFVFNMPATTIAAGSIFIARNVPIPALNFMVLAQNNTGQTWGNGGTTAPSIICAPFALQY